MNEFPAELPLLLVCHPDTPAPMLGRFEAGAELLIDGRLRLYYRLRGDMARIALPAQAAAMRTDLLWQHTCLEAFVAGANEAAYREFNFSPSGQWAAYEFTDYRQRVETAADISPPHITSRRTDGRLEVLAEIAAADLPPSPSGIWQLALTAVVEAADTVDGSHSYWALAHPAERPDFHLRAGFTLSLPRS